MQKTCTACRAPFVVSEDDLAAIAELAPTIGRASFPLPPPTHCPECRQQRRYACRNDRNYYPNSCRVCGKSLISSYSVEKPFGVLCDACFWSDRWDPLSFGRDYEPQTPFFGQFRILRETVPRLAIYHTQSENSEYTVHSSRNRNCYMASSLVDNEDVHYSDLTFESRTCMDLFSCLKMERCYECLFCEDCFQCEWCESCNNLADCAFCFDCKGSSMLIGCAGLRSARHRILNEEATEEACRDTVRRIKTDPAFRADFERKFRELRLRHPHRATWQINTEDCTGNYIWNSKGIHRGYNVRKMEDARYAYEEHSHTTTCDTTRVADAEMLYDCASIVDLKFSAFCNLTYQCGNLLYCDNCNGTRNCFGSVSLKKHQWCILNRQYTQGEYEALVPRIVEQMRTTGEWGEFFPIGISPFGYNETKAHEWYPLERAEAARRGWKWSDYEPPAPHVEKTIPGSKLPADIGSVPDDVLNWAIVCEASGKPFKLIRQELTFYRERGLPVPHRCPKQRHYDRIRPTNIRTLHERTCGKCGKAIQSIYAPERPEKVYCDSCYLKEVY